MTEPSGRIPLVAETALRAGLAHHQASRLTEAATCYQQVLRIVPDQPDALHYLGVALHQAGLAEAAVDHLERAVAGKPDSSEAYNHYGCALLSQARTEEAEVAFRRSTELNPAHAEAQFNLGTVLHTVGREREAGAALELAVRLAPDQVAWRVKLAEAMKDTGNLGRAEALLAGAVGASNDPVGAYFLRATVQELMGHGMAARRHLRRCMMLAPERIEPLNNLAQLDLMERDPGAARKMMRRAAAITPADPIIRFNLANALLANGNLAQGWWEYRWRHQKEEVQVNRRGLPPEWDGRPIRGGGLLIFHEQGIGDELRFASCFADAAKAAGGPCLVECDPRLRKLFSRSFPDLQFIEKLPREAGPPPTMDYGGIAQSRHLVAQTALGELPRHLRQSLDDFPSQKGYLIGAADARSSWRAKLLALGPGPKVGFLWRTGLAHKSYANYFFDILDLGPVFTMPGISMVNLQYDECEEDLRRAEEKFGIEIHRPVGIDLRNDLDDLAALISELDFVLGPMTSVVAMAGAVGTRCIGMNMTLDWTTLGTGGQPWTPSMNLIIKGSMRRWGGAVEEAARILARELAVAPVN